MKLTKRQQNKVIRSLKSARLLGAGQSFTTLKSLLYSEVFVEDLSAFLQGLKRDGKIMYFSTIRVWYWIDEVTFKELGL